MFATWATDRREPDFEWRLNKDSGGYRLQPPENYQALDPEFELPAGQYDDLDTALLNVEFQAVAVLVGRPEAPLHMHGALLSRDGRGLALVGAKECGKSTLSTYLWTQGWQLLSDDGFCFESTLKVRPVPRRVRLRESSHHLLPDLLSSELPAHDQLEQRKDGTLLFQPNVETPTVSLETLILLSEDEGDFSPIDSARATLDFLIHTNSYRIHGINPTLATLSGLLESVSCFKMGRAPLKKQYERLRNL